ncbi:MCE-family lipoprotein LprK (MCE-family lipoprotein Mce1e) [Actinokineospora spheciospongiae]|uniref:MCE-family lipoprotein LprK (MCE-family lipoprotein Mce1e) n=1 Tax=Actinokineospora spheciospongiae TaxID=909613 RepID=W7IRA0_9PSEU|nr:MCE family protein [Actinokineospora spheciospongiae]EWC63535.1 MCE-family lipoprotein LprK (MCE-family lipoprotein Mce1e) [Actinokineospora spheciospongiae]
MGARAVATRVAAAVGAVVLTASGCGFTGVYDLPLPGGADLGDHPYTVKVEFRDVLDLVPQSAVKVDEVAVGRVDSVGFAADGWTAEVTLLVRGDVDLPANASAKLRQSSLLGEKYVELAAPPTGTAAEGRLADGAVIPVGRTNRNTEVEEVLGALSLLLNGGGVEQLRDITRELNKATEGRETDIRALLDNVNSAVTTLDAGKADITRAIDGINRLAMTLNGQRDRIVGVIDGIGPGLKVLTDQREQLVTMLQSLDSLSGVAVDTVNRSQADLVADLKALTPTLLKLGEAGNDLPKSLELLITFPFTDAAVAGVKGDYFNIYADIDLNLSNVLDNLGRSRQNPLDSLIPGIGGTPAPPAGTGATPGTPAPPLLPLPPLPGLGTPTAPPAAGAPPTPARTGLPGLLDSLLGGGA